MATAVVVAVGSRAQATMRVAPAVRASPLSHASAKPSSPSCSPPSTTTPFLRRIPPRGNPIRTTSGLRTPVPVASRRRRSALTTCEAAAAAAPLPGDSSEQHAQGSKLHHALEGGLGSVVLLAATAVSIVLANSAVGPAWMGIFEQQIGPAISGHKLSIQGWINEGLMALFFFAVGLEIKRECVFGTLASIRQSILPCMAAVGGMVFPMLVYVALNAGTGGTMSGWAIPMATDIAFAMGVFGFFSKRMPRSASAFLLTLATVDDLGAIAVIAVFFASNILLPYLASAAALTAGLFTISKLQKTVSVWMYAVTGVALWYSLLVAGVNADVAGVVTAMAIPASAPAPKGSRAIPLEEGQAPTLMDHLIFKMLPWTALLVMPLFALANTAVPIDFSLLSGLSSQPVSLGIIAGLLIGKPVGITAFSLLAIKSGIARMPEGMGVKHLLVLGLLGGIGFTMCLFLIALALGATPDAMRLGKLAVIAASAVAAIGGAAIMRSFAPVEDPRTIDSSTPPSAPTGQPICDPPTA